jgi:DNA-binding beta-propeller fold protein YncE
MMSDNPSCISLRSNASLVPIYLQAAKAASNTLTLVFPTAGNSETGLVIAGPQGPPGDVVSADGQVLLVANALSELSVNPTIQQTAITNLGIANVDGGVFS